MQIQKLIITCVMLEMKWINIATLVFLHVHFKKTTNVLSCQNRALLLISSKNTSSQEFYCAIYQLQIGGKRIINKNIVHEGAFDQDFDNVDDCDIILVGGLFYFNLIDNEHHDYNND